MAGKIIICTLPGSSQPSCAKPTARSGKTEPHPKMTDYYFGRRIIATGSSTLSASSKFRDTLAGRKQDIWLTPMCLPDLADAKQPNFKHRFLRGGLPPFFLVEEVEERDFQEWIDAYWAKDIQELFRLERRDSFQKFSELVLAQSGGIFEATRLAGPCEVSRPTITNYLRVLEATFVAHIVRPFSTRKPTEIVSAPKVYGFDMALSATIVVGKSYEMMI